MGTKTVRLREDVYERIKARKRDDETFSEAVDRLTGDPSLTELAGIVDEEQASRMREAIETVDEGDDEDVEEILERFDDS
jgi:predicted CopG family antitoxin